MPIRKLLILLTLCVLLAAVAVPTFAQDATATAEVTATDVSPTAEATATVESAVIPGGETAAAPTTESISTSDSTTDPSRPIGTLILLVGLGTIVLVGGVMMSRERRGHGEGKD